MSKTPLSRTCYGTGLVTFGMLHALLFSFVVANSEFCGSVFKSQPDHTLVGHVMETATVADQFECQLKCISKRTCESFNLHPSADQKAKHMCELNNKTRQMKPNDFKHKKGSTYYGAVKVSCIGNSRGQSKQANGGHCHPGYRGKQCEVKKGSHPDYPGTSCKGIRDSTNTHQNGEYWIDPEGKGNPFKVYCDMTTDGVSAYSTGWVAYGKSYYLVINITTVKWSEARRRCQELGGDLAKITSAGENQFIFDLIRKQNINTNGGVWLGLHRKTDTKFYWVDGTPLENCTSWNTGEPNNPSTEKCGHMLGLLHRGKGKWNDISCSGKKNLEWVPVILCQKPSK